MAKSEKLWKLKRSGIHNHGMFAAADIAKGTRIIEYVGEKITKKESLKRCLAWEKKARKKGAGLVYIFDLDKKYDLDGNTDKNPAKYINHSCDDNCEAIDEDGRIFIYSRRNIIKGEELGFDYGYDLEHFMDHPCLCGSDNCCGFIVAKSSRVKLKAILRKQAKQKREKAAHKRAAKAKKNRRSKKSTQNAKR